MKRILILGGGFAGVECCLDLESYFKNSKDVEITLVSEDNFLLFTLLLIFLHSLEHGSHELADLFKSISEINFVFLLIIYFQPAAVITSSAAA